MRTLSFIISLCFRQRGSQYPGAVFLDASRYARLSESVQVGLLLTDGKCLGAQVLGTLQRELRLNMALIGAPTLAHLTRSMVIAPWEHPSARL